MRLTSLRRRVAREAAVLLYTLQEREYKQAKKRAAQALGTRILPSNLEVAEELDRIAEEVEGPSRKRLILQMREGALEIMRVLREFHPRLVGSVWRGSAHRNSDIDILVFSTNSEEVLAQLRKGGFKIARSEWCSVTKHGRKESSFHIYLTLPSGREAEIIVKSPEKMKTPERCEIYGDLVTGLSYIQLQRVLKEDPLRRFLPKTG